MSPAADQPAPPERAGLPRRAPPPPIPGPALPPPAADQPPPRERSGFRVLLRFLPYLWPEGAPGLKLRVAGSFLMVLLSICLTTLVMPQALGMAVDRMTAGQEGAATLAMALVAAYAAARFGGVLLDNLRNAVFETVGQ